MVSRSVWKRMRRWLVRGLTVFVLLQLTTWGWRPSGPVVLPTGAEPRELASYLERIVRTLSVDIGVRNYQYYQNLEAARVFVAREFEALGYTVTFQSFYVNGVKFSNVLARKGMASSAAPLVVGAHYDSCFNPGADDNASGVAGLLGLARALAGDPSVGGLLFVAFVNEEPPYFGTPAMGSRVFTRQWRLEGRPLRGAVVLEMIGYYSAERFSQRYLPLLGPFFPNRGNFIALVGDLNSVSFTRQLTQGLRRNSSLPAQWLITHRAVPRTNFSDHLSFWQEGYPAAMVTDTAFLRNPHYHLATDLPGTLDYGAMAVMIKGLEQTIRHLH